LIGLVDGGLAGSVSKLKNDLLFIAQLGMRFIDNTGLSE